VANYELRVAENVTCDLVDEIMFSEKGASQIHQSVLQSSRKTGVHRSSVGDIIHVLLRATRTMENNVPLWLLMYSHVVQQ